MKSVFKQKFRIVLHIFVSTLFLGFVSKSVAQVIDGDVVLNSQAEVDSMTATYITGSLMIRGADIVDLTNLSTLDSVGDNLTIAENDLLSNLDGLSNLIYVGGDLSLGGTHIGGSCERCLIGNLSITNLDGLLKLSSVGGDLSIISNSSLTDIDGLSNLTLIEGNMYIEGNNLLTNLNGLRNITAVNGDLYIFYNDTLCNLDGLSNLTSLGGNLWIDSNSSLTNLDGLSHFTFEENNLYIVNNDSLTNMDGLSNITSVDYLWIEGNDLIINLNWLNNLSSVSSGLDISYNDALTGFCGLYPLLSSNGLSGTYKVSGNSTKPTQQEIIDGGACLTVIGEKEQIPKRYELRQNYPNPFNPKTIIHYQLAMTSDVELSIYNVLGQEVATIVDKKQTSGSYQVDWDATVFTSGIYICKLKAGTFEQSRKMVLLR